MVSVVDPLVHFRVSWRASARNLLTVDNSWEYEFRYWLAGEYSVAVQEYDEWIKKLPDGKKVRYSYQLLIAGFSASMEILEPPDAMIYTHTHVDLPAPADRAQIEGEFADELAKAEHRRGVYAPLGRYRSAS